MKQISQSQFISISDTLCEIVKGLNESQIAATFESVVSRLCSSFDSVVIPPMAAVKNCLDLLIGEQRLAFINGAYYIKNAVASKPRKKLVTSPDTLKTKKQESSRHVLLSTKAATEAKRYMKRGKWNGYERLESDEVQGRTKIAKLDDTENYEAEHPTGHKLNKNDQSLEKKTKRKSEKNNAVKSSSLKVRKRNHCVPRRQFSYEEFHSHARQRELEDKKQIKKRNYFLGKLSRLFKMEDEKLTSNDENDNDSDNGWEKIVTNGQEKLLSNHLEIQQKRALEQNRERKNKRKKLKRIKDKTKHASNLSKNKNVQRNQECPSRVSSNNASSHSRSSDRRNTRNRNIEQKAKWKSSLTREQEDSVQKYSLSSDSESSCSLNNSDNSLSSESSVKLTRKSFHYSEEDTTDVESWQANRENSASNFCSTQAICGDLELSTLSLNPKRKSLLSSSSDTSSIEHVEKHSAVPGVNYSGVSDQQNNLRSRNLVQLIGIL